MRLRCSDAVYAADRDDVNRGRFMYKNCYTQKSLHRKTFTQSSLYTQQLLHREPFTHTHTSSYTQTFLHSAALTQATFQHRNFSQGTVADRQRGSYVFTQRNLYTQ